uniref:Uncharacterized protein n=1 Tax=Angiostrongylus cantonensis TaxID=6313 RepID=A0A0K0DMB9_ANGCA
MKENIMLSEEPFERFLSDAEVKVAELEHQLHELQKKANEKEASFPFGILGSKPSMGSIMSIEVTENDVHEGSATGEDEFNNDNSSQIMDELRFNEELYQIYSDCALFLGRPINSIEDYKDEKTIVKKELMLVRLIVFAYFNKVTFKRFLLLFVK